MPFSLGVEPVIGVIAKKGQAEAVEEFFQLFKTPWEYWKPDRRYDVVIATVDDLPTVDAKLLLLCGAETKSLDARSGITVRTRHKGGLIDNCGTSLPIYGECATFEESRAAVPCLAGATGMAGMRYVVVEADTIVVRLGYDLFKEIHILLSVGQPAEYAHISTLDIHIGMLRNWIVSEGIPLLEIPPSPAGYSFAVCLTHDIDFVGIREHKLDHTMWGFLYRSTVGAVRNFFRQRISLRNLIASWRAAASLPFVYLGWARDFWIPFEWYLRVEKGLPATYFLIPFKGRKGDKVPGKRPGRRATAYDVRDIQQWTRILRKDGCEIGVHGIDAWHDSESGQTERNRVGEFACAPISGIRMHWLLQDDHTGVVLERAGYQYDSSAGYNETAGYRNGTTQVFRRPGLKKLLELPMHVQDGALFFPHNLDLSQQEAEMLCKKLIENTRIFGGVLTLLWHDRSHAPERFWGESYVSLIQELKAVDAWFATGSQAVHWFQRRREVRFECIENSDRVRVLPGPSEEESPDFCLRVHEPISKRGPQDSFCAASMFSDIRCNADTLVELNPVHPDPTDFRIGISTVETC